MAQSQSIKNKYELKPIKTAMSRYFRSTLTLKGITYSQLSERLAIRGVVLTPENLRNKVARGLVPGDLFILLIDILGENHQALNVINNLAAEITSETVIEQDSEALG